MPKDLANTPNALKGVDSIAHGQFNNVKDKVTGKYWL
jgi:hypothetical protein